VETVTLWVDALLVAALAGWVGLGVVGNLQTPGVNASLVADVLAMRTMRKDFPEEFALVGSNRIEDPRVHSFIFAAIVIAEGVAALLLIIGAFGLAGGALGFWDPATTRIVAVLGTLAFTMVWSGFLVGGQWFYYWVSHQPAQHSHFLLAIWGIATLAILLRA
jgi:predicted small integral membrane protein